MDKVLDLLWSYRLGEVVFALTYSFALVAGTFVTAQAAKRVAGVLTFLLPAVYMSWLIGTFLGHDLRPVMSFSQIWAYLSVSFLLVIGVPYGLWEFYQRRR